METGRNRKVLFVAITIVIVAGLVIGVRMLNVPTTGAEGAIGAVEKHNAPQIKPSDVILGGEQLKERNALTFGDYLGDATMLRNVASSLSNRDAIANAVSQLNSHQADLQNRYENAAKEAVENLSTLLNKSDLANKGDLQTSLDSIQTKLDSSEALNAVSMESINATLESILEKLESSAGPQLAGYYYYGNWGIYSNAVRDLGSIQSLESKDLAGAISTLESATQQLENMPKPGSAFSLENHVEYLGIVAAESKSIENVVTELASAGKLESVASILNNKAAELQSAALDNLQAGLASQNQVASHIASAQKVIDNLESLASSSKLDNASFNAALNSFSQALESREAQLEAFTQGNMQSQLNAIESYLNSQSLDNEAAMAPLQSFLSNISASIQNKDMGIGSMDLADRDQLSSKATELANKAGTN